MELLTKKGNSNSEIRKELINISNYVSIESISSFMTDR
jgi:hypothetical protein